MAEERLKVRQVRSEIGRSERTRDTLNALGLGGIGKSKELPSNPAVLGMLRKVAHLVEIEPAK